MILDQCRGCVPFSSSAPFGITLNTRVLLNYYLFQCITPITKNVIMSWDENTNVGIFVSDHVCTFTQQNSHSISHYAVLWLHSDKTVTMLSPMLTAGSTVTTLPLAAQSLCSW